MDLVFHLDNLNQEKKKRRSKDKCKFFKVIISKMLNNFSIQKSLFSFFVIKIFHPSEAKTTFLKSSVNGTFFKWFRKFVRIDYNY